MLSFNFSEAFVINQETRYVKVYRKRSMPLTSQLLHVLKISVAHQCATAHRLKTAVLIQNILINIIS